MSFKALRIKSCTFRRFALSQSACRSHSSRCFSGRPWPSVYLAKMLPWVRHPRIVHCAEYPQASKLNLGGHGEPVNALFFLETRIVDCNAVEERIGVNAFGAHSAYHVSEFVAHEFAVIEAFLGSVAKLVEK